MAQLTPFLAKLKHSRSDQVTRAVIEKNTIRFLRGICVVTEYRTLTKNAVRSWAVGLEKLKLPYFGKRPLVGTG